MKKALLTYLFLVFIISGKFLGQTPNYISIGKQEFAGIDIYSMIVHKNLLYVSSNQGLYKQEYNSFIKVPFKKNGVNSLFDLCENNGNLYCKSLKGNIYKLTNDSLQLYYTVSKKHFTDNFSFFFDKKNRLIIIGDSINRINENGSQINLMNEVLDSNDKKTHPFFAHKIKNDDLFISANINGKFAYLYDNDHLTKYQINDNKKELGGDMYLYKKDSSFIVLCKNGKWHSNTGSSISTQLKLFESYYLMKNGNILGVGEKFGARILTIKEDTLIELKSFFKDQFISSICENDEGTIFFGTFGEGIMAIHNHDQTKIESPDKITSIAKNNNNNPVFSTVKGDVYELKNKKFELIDHSNNKIENIFFTKMKLGSPVQKQNKVIFRTDKFKIGSIKDICLVSDSLTLFAEHNTISAFTTKTTSYSELLKNFELESSKENINQIYKRYYQKNRYYSIAFDKINKVIYASCSEGIINLSTNEFLKIENKKLKGSKIRYYQDQLILATSNGILFVKENKIVDSLTLTNGLYDNFIQDLKLDGNLLFIKNRKGIQLFNLTTKKLRNLRSKHGIGDEIIIDFELIDSMIWIATKNEIYNIPVDLVLEKEQNFNFAIDYLTMNKEKFALSQQNFSHTQNELDIFVSYPDIFNEKEGKFIYQMVGLDKYPKTASAENYSFHFDYIPPGDYRFKIFLEVNNETSSPLFYNFSIQKPFYQRGWFYFLCGAILLSLLYILYRYRIAQIEKKNKAELEKEILSKNLLDSELKALRSQMNPHFIFNSLNSIQNLVLKQDTNQSYDYIEMFSELVRNTLNYSEKEFIPIDKELKFLEVYLNLEKLRFKDEFSYTINYHNSTDIQVPSILVQPFIENSLKHGLLHKKGEKKLDITFELTDKLICKIRDNGIGRSESDILKKQSKRAHESFSMRAINKRLEILSKQYEGNFYYSVEDLLDNGKPSGTEITLIMPFVK